MRGGREGRARNADYYDLMVAASQFGEGSAKFGSHNLVSETQVVEGKSWVKIVCKDCDPPRQVGVQEFMDAAQK
jgi:hypothetical protein